MMDAKAKFDELINQVMLAGTYMSDGALRTSAAKLRAAADIADELADYELKMLAELMQRKGDVK